MFLSKINNKSILYFLFFLTITFFSFSFTHAQEEIPDPEITSPFTIAPTLHAVPEGGRFDYASTWVENRVPTENDVVEINGLVTLRSDTTIGGVLVTTGSTLAGYRFSTYNLQINGDLQNYGTINRYARLTITGSVDSQGVWDTATYLEGENPRILSGYFPHAVYLNSPITVTSSNNLEIKALATNNNPITFIEEGARFTVNELSGDLITNADIHFDSVDELFSKQSGNITAQNVHIHGLHKIREYSFNVESLIIYEGATLSPTSSFTSYTVNVDGDIINNGTITQYIKMRVGGDINNNGTWQSDINIYGENPRIMEGIFPITVNLETPIVFSNNYVTIETLVTGGFDTIFNDSTAQLTLNNLSGDLSTNGIVVFGFDDPITTSQRNNINAQYIVFNNHHRMYDTNQLDAELVLVQPGARLAPRSNFQTTHINIYGDIINLGSIDRYMIPYLYGSVSNLGDWIPTTTYLAWEESVELGNYEFALADEESEFISTESFPLGDVVAIGYDPRDSLRPSISSLINGTESYFWRSRLVDGEWSKTRSINAGLELPNILKEQDYFSIEEISDTERYQTIDVQIHTLDPVFSGTVDIYLEGNTDTELIGQVVMDNGLGSLSGIILDSFPGTYRIIASDAEHVGESNPFNILEPAPINDFFTLSHNTELPYGTSTLDLEITSVESDYSGIIMLGIEGLEITPTDTAIIDGYTSTILNFTADPGTYTIEVSEGHHYGSSSFVILEEVIPTSSGSGGGSSNNDDGEVLGAEDELGENPPDVEEQDEEEIIEPSYLINNICWRIKSEKIIKIGNKDKEANRIIQTKLNSYGYDVGAVDGDFGNKTKFALIDFQKDNNLSADGIFGTGTSKFIDENCDDIQPKQTDEPLEEELEEEVEEHRDEDSWIDDISNWFEGGWNIFLGLFNSNKNKEEFIEKIIEELPIHEILDKPVDIETNSPFLEDRSDCNICSDIHGGTDYPVPENTSIKVTANGVVVRSYYSRTFGNTIIIHHGPSTIEGEQVFTLYAHGAERKVEVRDLVSIGDEIMLSGNTGTKSTGPHLHYEVISSPYDIDSQEFYITDKYKHRYAPDSLFDLLNV